MTDKQLIKYVKSFRSGILGKKGTPDNKCFMVCSPLVTLLKMGGMECELREGYIAVHGQNGTNYHQHYWIELSDGRIIDPTANQFEKHDVEIYLGEKPTWYMNKKKKRA